ncbi:mitochondrial carrier domain-containing protein [Leucosporidium creatinivorum]|uniref:Mitochondrial carrier domain-containing protein n=1 Tax=Leucosporidium creatinivorum TaxID=106004 RepID=A0A1Y2G1F1_9BASI|nr:mitochondrial carrier domain-containing protein [Leucosporidium creatinivorum]
MSALSPFGMACAGALGGCVSNAVVYPLDTIKTRIQTEVSSSNTPSSTTPAASLPSALKRPGAPRQLPARKGISARQMLFRILKQQGVAGLYRGFGASMLNTFSMQFAYFYWYTIVRRTYLKRFPTVQALNTVTELALGALAAAFAQLFTIPVSVIATRQQLANKSVSFLTTLKDILADDGITGLWRGLKPSLVLTINPAITYGMFERLKTAFLKEGEKMTPGKAFVIGALSKTMATVVTYPYIMAKTRLQAKYEDDAPDEEASIGAPSEKAKLLPKQKRKERYSGALDVLRQEYKQNGFAGWYQGMQAQITKAVLSQALLFGIKDLLEAYVVLSLIYYSKLRGAEVGIKKL